MSKDNKETRNSLLSPRFAHSVVLSIDKAHPNLGHTFLAIATQQTWTSSAIRAVSRSLRVTDWMSVAENNT